jgi:hypothetical protein
VGSFGLSFHFHHQSEIEFYTAQPKSRARRCSSSSFDARPHIQTTYCVLCILLYFSIELGAAFIYVSVYIQKLEGLPYIVISIRQGYEVNKERKPPARDLRLYFKSNYFEFGVGGGGDRT